VNQLSERLNNLNLSSADVVLNAKFVKAGRSDKNNIGSSNYLYVKMHMVAMSNTMT